eukprot:4308941-Pleurochrysis_carterae.AAC.4
MQANVLSPLRFRHSVRVPQANCLAPQSSMFLQAHATTPGAAPAARICGLDTLNKHLFSFRFEHVDAVALERVAMLDQHPLYSLASTRRDEYVRIPEDVSRIFA